MSPSDTERARQRDVLDRVVQYVRENRLIPAGSSLFQGSVAAYEYAFEGEEDLLHLDVHRVDGGFLSVEEGQEVVGFVLPDTPRGLIWAKPGVRSQHFYLGHDWLL